LLDQQKQLEERHLQLLKIQEQKDQLKLLQKLNNPAVKKEVTDQITKTKTIEPVQEPKKVPPALQGEKHVKQPQPVSVPKQPV